MDLRPRCSVTLRAQCTGGLCEYATKLMILQSPPICTFPSPTPIKYQLPHKLGKSEESAEPTDSGLF